MTIKAEIVADTINPARVRITTFRLTYPNIIHPEFLTHREKSRNSASNRAIPTEKYLGVLKSDPFVPEVFYENRSGMVGGEPLPPEKQEEARQVWLDACNFAIQQTEKLHALNVHKQHANRLLSPFIYVETLATATTWDNFFALRLAPDAQPEIQELAGAMLEAYRSSKPKEGIVHLPYVTQDEIDEVKHNHLHYFTQTYDYIEHETIEGNDLYMSYERVFSPLMFISANRCKRVSFLRLDKHLSLEKEIAGGIEMYQKFHFSPLEHPALALGVHKVKNSNFHPSWMQFRQMLKKNVLTFDYAKVAKP